MKPVTEEMSSKELNRTMIESAVSAKEATGAASLLLFLDAVEDWESWKEFASDGLILATQRPECLRGLEEHRGELKGVIGLPPVKLTRLGQIKLSVIISLTEGLVTGTETVVCLSGSTDYKTLDTLVVLDLSRESDVVTSKGISRDLIQGVNPEVFETVLNLALELATEGREGRPLGTIFVIGDNEKVMELSRPLIMNPFRGYPEETRNIIDDSVHETIKEFSLLDGAFVIRGDGVVVSAGTHLDAALGEGGHKPGLGSRHMAAAGITDVTESVAISISGSTGMVRIFRKGRVVMEIERPSKGKAELMAEG